MLLLSEKLKYLREEKGLSQEELAIKLNVVRQTVSKWEKGLSTPNAEMLVHIAAVFETSVGALLDEEQAPTEEEHVASEPIGNERPKHKFSALSIVLLILGSPLWVPLLAAALIVILAVYIVIWAVVISLWAVFGSGAACAVGGIVSGIVLVVTGQGLKGIAVIGASLACAGLTIFMFCGCKATTKGVLWLTKKIALSIKTLCEKG